MKRRVYKLKNRKLSCFLCAVIWYDYLININILNWLHFEKYQVYYFNFLNQNSLETEMNQAGTL